MEAMILDRNFTAQCIIDAFESFIWTDRYAEPGDFEIYMPIAKAPMEFIKRDYYLWIKESDRLQIIEDITITTDAEQGDHITVVGRTLESLLERRVVWAPTAVNSSLQSGIQKLLNENAINPRDSKRRIPQLRFVWNTDERVEQLNIENFFFGETLLDIVEAYCELYGLGFKVIFNDELSTFDFSLYYGEDRSYDQEENPWVVFSAAYNNLIGSNYFESFKNLRTAAIIASDDDEDYGQEIVEVDDYPNMTGLDRREMFVDGSNVRWEVNEPDEEAIEEQVRNSLWAIAGNGRPEREIQERVDSTIQAYWDIAKTTAQESVRAQLKDKGEEALSETFITKSFEGTIEAVRQYVYGVDFFIGDIVQVRNQYGKEASSRITEVIRSHDTTGYSLIPTFTTLIGSDNEGDIRE